MLGVTIYYRFESIACAIMIARLYHSGKLLIMFAEQNYFSAKNSLLMQDMSTFRQIQDQPLLRRALALKLLVTRHPIYTLLFFLCHLFFSQTYLLRIAGKSCLRMEKNVVVSDWIDQRDLPISLTASIGQTRCG